MLDRAAVESAWERIRSHVRRTPCLTVASGDLGLAPDFELVLKLESLQHTGSFKPRGAFHRVLCGGVPASGLIAASGGNHGLAVAYVACRLELPSEVFVPTTAPPVKVERLRRLGTAAVQVGEVYDDAWRAAQGRAAETGAMIVHAYDQPEVIAGAGTVAMELEQQVGSVDSVLVAVGGGGLIGGILAWYAERTRVVAVEPRACPTLHAAMAAGRPVPVQVGGIAVDSLAGPELGGLAFECASRWLADSVLVEDGDIVAAQHLLWDRLRLIAEPGGATALSGLLSGAVRPAPGSRVAVLVCGANTDPANLSRPGASSPKGKP